MSSDVGFYEKFIPCRISFDLLSRIELSACVFFPIYDRYRKAKRKLDGIFFSFSYAESVP